MEIKQFLTSTVSFQNRPGRAVVGDKKQRQEKTSAYLCSFKVEVDKSIEVAAWDAQDQT